MIVMPILIELKGIRYWFIGESFDEDGGIAPLHHCDDKGNPIVLEESYAHFWPPNEINRYGKQIATLADVKILTAPRRCRTRWTSS